MNEQRKWFLEMESTGMRKPMRRPRHREMRAFFSCLENPMDGGVWLAAVHEVAKSWTWLSDFTLTSHFHALEKEMATHSIRSSWSEPQSAPGLVFADCIELPIFACKEYNQSDFSVDHLVTIPVFLLGKFHRQWSLVGYGQRGRKEPDTT